ncbi:ABC transporter ATP-binding protein [Dietzia sp. PP-33]|uniref:ABC transporter ATP-binding protein n=1 Tax=Dietzia sp. PP-33 TaxID=2957500 RepID=UPI0029AD86D7|nr:ABC transporter ATP-binding protein [Dietzia sp. PP-33]MDX2358083.1 ABC transporter ATP-binding protein/permease [Dietzia sp. PP-33]
MSALPVATAAQTRREAARQLRPRAWALSVALLVLLAASIGRVVSLLALGGIVDAVTTQNTTAFAWLLALLTTCSVAGVVLAWQGTRLLGTVLLERTARLRESVMRAALTSDSSQIEAAGSGDVVSRVSEDTAAVGSAASRVLPVLVSATLTTVVTLAGVAVLDPRLAAVMLIAVPVQLLSLRRFLRRSRPVYRQLKASQSQRSQHLVEGFAGAESLRALGAEPVLCERFARASRAVVGYERQAARVRTGFQAGLNVAELLGLGAVLAAGFLLAGADLVTAGAVAAAALAFHNLFGPIGVLLSSVDELQNAAASLARLTGVLGSAPASASASRRREGGRQERMPQVRLSGVSFSYPGRREVLHHVELDLAPGSTTTVVGLSGAGKTTVAKLVAGLLRPTEGDVHRPGDTRVAMVSQEIHVFRGTVWDNLRLAAPHATKHELEHAAIELGATWIHSLPAAGDTILGDGGHPLPAAHAQHLALVRAHLTRPGLVVLDEATAEAGSTDSLVLDKSVGALVSNRTALLVAHRLEQCLLADTVVYMEDGTIAEIGTHDALLDSGGSYAALWCQGGSPRLTGAGPTRSGPLSPSRPRRPRTVDNFYEG